jgi:putative FmdB family regulatory protein
MDAMPIYEIECRLCGKKSEYYDPLPNDRTHPCPACGGQTDRLYSLSVPRLFKVFETTNILPDGTPITVKGSGQLAQLENEHHVRLVDEPSGKPPATKFPEAGLGEAPGWYKS